MTYIEVSSLSNPQTSFKKEDFTNASKKDCVPTKSSISSMAENINLHENGVVAVTSSFLTNVLLCPFKYICYTAITAVGCVIELVAVMLGGLFNILTCNIFTNKV